MFSMRSVYLGILSVAAVVFLSGCGNKYGTPVKVSGKVTADDKPLANAVVTLNFTGTGDREAAARSFQATTGAGGEYEIPEVFPGEYEVTVAATGGPAVDPTDLGKQSAVPDVLVPVDGPSLKVTVADSPVTFDIKMTKK